MRKDTRRILQFNLPRANVTKHNTEESSRLLYSSSLSFGKVLIIKKHDKIWSARIWKKILIFSPLLIDKKVFGQYVIVINSCRPAKHCWKYWIASVCPWSVRDKRFLPPWVRERSHSLSMAFDEPKAPNLFGLSSGFVT